MPWTVARPRPVPSPGPLVVKNGSKARSATSGAMPVPSSETRDLDAVAGAADGDRQRPAVGHRVAGVDGEVHEHLLELRAVGEHGRQLRRRTEISQRDVLAERARSSDSTSATSALRSSTSGVTTSRRLNVSSWRVSAAARSAARPISIDVVADRRVLLELLRANVTQDRITDSRLLKSWATPPASWPTLSRRCACASRCSSSRRSRSARTPLGHVRRDRADRR